MGQGSQYYFSGGPSTFSQSALKVSLDIKQVQEVAASKVLDTLYEKVGVENQEVNIISKLYNFSYRRPFDFKLKPQMMLSFVVELLAKDTDDNIIFTNTINIKDSLGEQADEPIGLGSALLWPLIQSDADKMSQYIGEILLKKIYAIYVVEFEKIAKIHLQRIENK